MKKVIFVIAMAFISLTASAQLIQYGTPRNVLTQKVVIDSLIYSQDSVPTFYFKIIRTIADTTGQMRSTPAELKKVINYNQEVLKAATKSINARYLYVRDSIKDQAAQQAIMQEIQQMDMRAKETASQLDMFKATKKAFEAKLLRK